MLTEGGPLRGVRTSCSLTRTSLRKSELFRSKSVRVTLSCLALLLLFVKPAHAQHGDWLLGTDGLLSAQQAPEGILYQNLWSYYHASGNSFLQAGPCTSSEPVGQVSNRIKRATVLLVK
jgi:hypothetical protein